MVTYREKVSEVNSCVIVYSHRRARMSHDVRAHLLHVFDLMKSPLLLHFIKVLDGFLNAQLVYYSLLCKSVAVCKGAVRLRLINMSVT